MKKINPVFFWPSWFLESFNESDQKNINKITLNKLAKSQIYLWDALNIYDDILDNSSDARKLPLANKYSRNFLEIYYRLNLPSDFYKQFNSILKDLEDANKKEFIQKKLNIHNGIIYNPKINKLPDLRDLSKKSLALISGPLAILYLINNQQSIPKVSGLIIFFKYALAAKQLSDDAKDWLEDLKNGFITYPNSLILKIAKERNIKLDINRGPEIIYLLFAEIAPHISKSIKFLCNKARREAKKINLSDSNPLLLNIIKPLELAVLKAQKFSQLLKNNQ